MLLFLANIGDVMADIFRFVYSKVSENYHAKGRIGREGGGGGGATPDSKIRGGGIDTLRVGGYFTTRLT